MLLGILQNKKKRYVLLFVLVVGWIGVALAPRIVITLAPGQAGVLWKRFDSGTQMDGVYGPGRHLIFPWDKVYFYSTKQQEHETSFMALTQDGRSVNIAVTARFTVHTSTLPLLHRKVGQGYPNRVVIPQIQSVVRRMVGQYHTQDVTNTSPQVRQQITSAIIAELAQHYVTVNDIILDEFLVVGD